MRREIGNMSLSASPAQNKLLTMILWLCELETFTGFKIPRFNFPSDALTSQAIDLSMLNLLSCWRNTPPFYHLLNLKAERARLSGSPGQRRMTCSSMIIFRCYRRIFIVESKSSRIPQFKLAVSNCCCNAALTHHCWPLIWLVAVYKYTHHRLFP